MAEDREQAASSPPADPQPAVIVAAVTPALLNAEAAAALLGLSRRHFQSLDASGRIGPRAIKLGKSARWSRDELERWAAAGCPGRSEWNLRSGGSLVHPDNDRPANRMAI